MNGEAYVTVQAKSSADNGIMTLSASGGQVGGSYILKWTAANGFTNKMGWTITPVALFGGSYDPLVFPYDASMSVDEVNRMITSTLSGKDAYYSMYIVLSGCGENA